MEFKCHFKKVKNVDRFYTKKVHFDEVNTRVYPKVSGLAAWSENCK